MALDELQQTLDQIPLADARIVRQIVGTLEGFVTITDQLSQGLDLLNRLDDLRRSEIRELQRTVTMLVSHLGLDAAGGTLADQLRREAAEDRPARREGDDDA